MIIVSITFRKIKNNITIILHSFFKQPELYYQKHSTIILVGIREEQIFAFCFIL